MKKKIVFFDGDGTIWYPKRTKWKEGPWWIYKDKETSTDSKFHLVLTPTAHSTLKKLKTQGIILILLSTHPHSPREAKLIIDEKVRHFNLKNIFDEVHATREYHHSKGEFILKILNKRKIPKSQALMVGDHYLWDYKPARDVGIDALLIKTDYTKFQKNGNRIKKTIRKIKEILNYV
ncbi:hypothetical protein AUJ84_00390 [Candidatus Pacearchaeota archaeon CG1_02_32_132]|nr:MAG: hypothetical protein AUJ84_00390 [Candidatus Pacearchaeota archaeon CG1_02_32_132]